VLDVINHAKFQIDRFRGFEATGGRKSLSSIDWRYRPYNSVGTNVMPFYVIIFWNYKLSKMARFLWSNRYMTYSIVMVSVSG